MKTTLMFALIIILNFFLVQFVTGQTENTLTRSSDSFKTSILSDSAKNRAKSDIVINMEMIESFRRCYDKIEVIDWAGLLKGSSSDELGIIYMAYRRMQENGQENNTTKTLVAEVEKVKNEIASNTTIKINKAEQKVLLTAANLNTK